MNYLGADNALLNAAVGQDGLPGGIAYRPNTGTEVLQHIIHLNPFSAVGKTETINNSP